MAFLVLIVAPAASQESFLDSLGRAAGLTAPKPEPPDFVKASRPAQPAAEIPVFATPPEPRSRVKSAAELKAMDAELENASSRQGGKPARTKPRRDRP